MLAFRIGTLGVKKNYFSIAGNSYSHLCALKKKKRSCSLGKAKSGGTGSSDKLRRAERSGKCRMGFIPEEWFQFMHSKTGVSGPYVLGLVVTNYLCSKEIFVMEHEYYLGLSILTVLYYVTTKLGPPAAANLDKQVDEVVADFEKGRNQDIALFKGIIKESKKSQWMAKGQEELMNAKKENVALQLEAIYRERSMMVYHGVKGRMDYHVKKYYTEARIHQRWMIKWILNNVMRSITPEFEQRALDQAIRDLSAAAKRA